MSIYTLSLILILGSVVVTPYFICVILRFALWKYQFQGKPTQLFNLTSYKDIIMKINAGLNMNLLISINQLSVQFWPIIKINISGLQISILVKNEFNQWKNHQIELFKMLDDIRTRLKRGGMLQTSSSLKMFSHNEAQRDLTTSSLSDSMPQSHIRGASRLNTVLQSGTQNRINGT